MLFSNETVYLEVLIGGYTDRPWYFKTEHMGRNALSCQVSYSNKETGREFVMWNELLQTEELGAIRDGLEKVLAGAEEKFVFHSEYETFAIAIGTLEDGFEVIVQVQNFGGNVWERFYLGKESLGEVLEYLRFCCEKYPIRFFEDEFIEQILKEPVKYIDVSKDGFWLLKENLCDADHVMVVFSDCAYLITSTRIAEEEYDFAVSKCSDYNKALYEMQITSWENKDIRCLGFESDEFSRYLRFEIDGSYLLLTPNDMGLMVGFTGWDTEGKAYDMKRHALFKGYEDV